MQTHERPDFGAHMLSLDARHERGVPLFWLKCFMKGYARLNPNSSETGHFIIIIVAYLGHGIFHPR